ncbi:MAG: LPS-assembly protein LptD [Comamonadaceae bacterium]|nr:MAG: LPS-assembly protein LptD [Comamonadaceae bacterium]
MRSASPWPFILSPVPRAVLSLVSTALLGLGYGAAAHAQVPLAMEAPADFTSRLKMSPMLAEKPPEGPANEPPTFIFGDGVSGRPELETIITGNAEIRRGPTAIKADRIEYYQPDDLFKARGNVRINSSGNKFDGPDLQIKLDTFEGFFTEPNYRFLANGGNGHAQRIDFVSDKQLIARQATFTTCERNDEASWSPAWVLSGTSFKFDMDEETGEATGAVLRFKNIPILAAPVISFPLSDKRKSGFLPPTFNVDTTSGVLVTQPYYFNIAPNRDATFSPTVMSKRGLQLAGEARYLEPTYTGKISGSYLPGDKLREEDRWSYGLLHAGTFQAPAGIGTVGLNLNLNRVSDNNYWRDFPRTGTSLTERLLSNDAQLSWGRGYFSTAIRALKWQTLQDITSPIVPPYDRLPQLTARYARIDAPIGSVNGFDWSVDGDYTRFSADRALTGQPNADRTFARAQVSYPMITPAGFITPKFQLNATSYKFDGPLANGNNTASRVLPTFSLDSGLQFERNAAFLGRNFTQTLEPRAFYVRTPYRDQSLLPNYDSGLNDFNFATIFTENAFVGNDRISDANLLTLGVTSRLLDPDTGAENVRFGVAQRLRFQDQRVTLPGQLPATDRISDLLFGTSINWVPEWNVEGTVQYNPNTKQSERSTFSARYNPGDYRVVSASLRRQRNVSNLVDVAWQWPINDLWESRGKTPDSSRGKGEGRYYGVGRLNYSIPDRRLVDTVVGVEYDGCCWVGRVVLQRSQSSTATSNTRILFQLELVGFSRIGSNPLETLKSNIPRYKTLHEQTPAPSRFTQYD